jgi:DNA repair exonuclease SbcCD ATPase subunit
VFAHRRSFPSRIQIVFIPGIVLVALSGFCQSGNGRVPPGNTEAQQTQQDDKREQELQREQQEEALRHPFDNLEQLEQLQSRIWQLEFERIRLKQLLRENFRRHYAVIRRNAVELVQLASSLQTSLESNGDPALARDMKAKAARMQKLAHEVRESMAGWKVPKAKALAANAPGITAGIGADNRQLLRANVAAANTAASQLKSAVDDYLASANEHTVSVSALQAAADQDRFDPHVVAILNNSVQLERLAPEIRSKIKALYPSR